MRLDTSVNVQVVVLKIAIRAVWHVRAGDTSDRPSEGAEMDLPLVLSSMDRGIIRQVDPTPRGPTAR